FQAEDGIRDKLVTGVQTCALPICRRKRKLRLGRHWSAFCSWHGLALSPRAYDACRYSGLRYIDTRYSQYIGSARRSSSRIHRLRSEERRVGKECRSRRERE